MTGRIEMIRQEYPRPQFLRKGKWTNLNGSWFFAFDDNNVGQSEHWQKSELFFDQKIQVPFVYQAKESGINNQEVHDVVWYQRKISIDTLDANERIRLHFGAVDYFADIYINGDYIGSHEGGDSPFEFDITNALVFNQEQTLTVRVSDRTYDETIPRGKQSWTGHAHDIWYTNSTGIWQTVWLEYVPTNAIENVYLTPDLDRTAVKIDTMLSDRAVGKSLQYIISFKGEVIVNDTILITQNRVERNVDLVQQHIFRTSFHNEGWTWTPNNPNLFDITFKLLDEDTILDTVDSYFGLRKVSTENGMIMLNNRPFYQRLVLDQGYWPDGLLTASSDEAFRQDIDLAKQAGFNGCRKHQKVEDPRFLYWADKLGYLVWEEVSSVPYFSAKSASRLIDAWKDTIERDYNHPSIIMWVPLNESWGVDRIHYDTQQQHFSEALYHMIHALDTTRLVQSNDGWENTVTDVVTVHNYSHGQNANSKEYRTYLNTLTHIDQVVNNSAAAWDVFAKGFHYEGQPIVLSEFGGIGFDFTRDDGWGFTTAKSEDDYINDLKRLCEVLQASDCLWGYCYTQLTDVEQETNGIFTVDRKSKVPLETLNTIFNFNPGWRLNTKTMSYRQE